MLTFYRGYLSSYESWFRKSTYNWRTKKTTYYGEIINCDTAIKTISPVTRILCDYARSQFKSTFNNLFSRYKDNIVKSNNSDIKIIQTN